MIKIAPPRIPEFIPDPFSLEEIQGLRKACKGLRETSGIRATAIVLFLLDTGVRMGELISLEQLKQVMRRLPQSASMVKFT